jgi:hypothetical protein
MIPT